MAASSQPSGGSQTENEQLLRSICEVSPRCEHLFKESTLGLSRLSRPERTCSTKHFQPECLHQAQPSELRACASLLAEALVPWRVSFPARDKARQ